MHRQWCQIIRMVIFIFGVDILILKPHFDPQTSRTRLIIIIIVVCCCHFLLSLAENTYHNSDITVYCFSFIFYSMHDTKGWNYAKYWFSALFFPSLISNHRIHWVLYCWYDRNDGVFVIAIRLISDYKENNNQLASMHV